MSNFVESTLRSDFDNSLAKFEKNIQENVLINGAAAMAKVLYDEARTLCPVSDQAHFFYGTQSKKTGVKYYFAPGNLKAAIYRVFSPERSGQQKKTYRISWNHFKAPYGFMVEFGTSNAAAHPFMRPAFDRVNEAIQAGRDRMKTQLAGNMAEVAG